MKLVSRGASQQPVELLELAAFALPPHPRVFARVPAPRAMEQKEAIGVLGAEPPIEILDAGARGGKDRRVLGQLARFGVGEVAEDREMDARIEVAEREHLHVLQQRRHRVGARQQRRHDDHRAGVVRDALNAIGEVETRQTTRRERPGDHALSERDRDVGGRDQQQQQRDGHERRRMRPRARRYAALAASRSAVMIAIGPR